MIPPPTQARATGRPTETGATPERMMPYIADGVAKETGRAQVPWESSSLQGEFAFVPGVAAPSANLFSRPSPTTAAHVIDDLGLPAVKTELERYFGAVLEHPPKLPRLHRTPLFTQQRSAFFPTSPLRRMLEPCRRQQEKH